MTMEHQTDAIKMDYVDPANSLNMPEMADKQTTHI